MITQGLNCVCRAESHAETVQPSHPPRQDLKFEDQEQQLKQGSAKWTAVEHDDFLTNLYMHSKGGCKCASIRCMRAAAGSMHIRTSTSETDATAPEDFDAGELAGNVTWTAPVDDRYVSSYQASPMLFKISLTKDISVLPSSHANVPHLNGLRTLPCEGLSLIIDPCAQ